MKIAIKNANIITMDKNMTQIENGYIIIENDKIAKIGDMQDYQEEVVEEEIDANGDILMPGMVNTHTHISMIPFRSLGDDCKDRLRRFLFPLEMECMTEELVYKSAKYAICELLLSGVTTIVDMYYFESEVARAVDELGIRAVLGETVIDFATCDSDKAYGGLEYGEKFIKRWIDNERITPFIAPHAPNTNNTEALIKSNEISKKYNVPISMHISEMDYELKHFREKYDKTPIEYLESIGVLSERLIAAHTIFLTDNDIELIKKYNVKIAHCIGANTKSAKGICPVSKLVEKDIIVGLGTDGPSSGNTLDLITQFKLFANFHKYINKDRSVFPASSILRLGTIEGAKVINKEKEIGSIEVGKKADLVIVDTKSVNMFPMFDVYSVLVYSANASNIKTVFVDGKCLVKDRKFTNIDFDKIREDLIDEMREFKIKAKDKEKEILE